jgi:hypothetical protein
VNTTATTVGSHLNSLRISYFILVALFSCALGAQSYYDYVRQQLAEAEAYLTVDPAQSLKLLDAIGPLSQPVDEALRWHILQMRAAVPTAQLERMLTSLDVVFRYHNHPAFAKHLTSINSAAAIWLRRHNYLHEAIVSLQCAEKYAVGTSQKLTLLNSMGLVNRQLDDNTTAKQQFNQALELATATKNNRVIAMVQNNLGLLALEQGELGSAVQHLRAALTHYQTISLRSGQISAGLNLLLVYILQKDEQSIQRLYSPTATLTTAFPNEAKQALLLWLQAAQQQLQGQPLSGEQKQALQQAYRQIDDPKTQLLLHKHLASALKIEINASQLVLQQGFDRPWFSLIKACQWPLPTLTDNAP